MKHKKLVTAIGLIGMTLSFGAVPVIEMPGAAQQSELNMNTQPSQNIESSKSIQSSQAREEYAFSLGVLAYIYGVPLVLMGETKQTFTTRRSSIPNQFTHTKFPATPDSLYPGPNVDTLYSNAWLDLSQEPLILHVPDTQGRYYIMQMIDAYSNNFASIGMRTTGTQEGNYGIVGPNWRGALPKGIVEIKAPTNMVWLLGRTLFNNEADLPKVHQLQQQYQLAPLSEWVKLPGPRSNKSNLQPANNPAPSPNRESGISPFAKVKQMDWPQFCQAMVALMQQNPTRARDAVLLSQFEPIGIKRNQDCKDLDPITLKGLNRAIQVAQQAINVKSKEIATNVNGWVGNYTIGAYGDDFLLRAANAINSGPTNIPQDALYFRALVDTKAQQLNGANRYLLHFDQDQIPPVNAFWSVTMYGMDYRLVANPIKRYAIRDRTEGLKYNTDGSLDIYIQHEAPPGKESNWLPAPAGDFRLSLRLYMPKPEVLKGAYQVPGVKRIPSN